MKRLKGEEEGREKVNKLIRGRELGMEMEVKEMRKINTRRDNKGNMMKITLKTEEMKRKILENKRRLRGKEVWIEEDLTFRERKIKWNLRQIAMRKEREGNIVKVGYYRI